MESTYLLVGQSIFLIQEQIKAYQEKFNIDQFNIVRLDALDTEIESINQELQTVSFFSDLKMVIIENVNALTRYDDSTLKPFLNYLEKPSEDIVLVLTALELPKQHILSNYLERFCYIETIQSLEGDALKDYVKNLFNKAEYSIDVKAIDLLIERCQSNLFLIHQEANKLQSYAYDTKVITESDIKLLVTRNLEDNVFAFTDAYLKGQISVYMQIYDDLIVNKMPPISIFNQLFNTMQMILQTQHLLDAGLSQKSIAENLGVSSGRAYHLINGAKGQSKKSVEKLIKGLSELDVEIKSGQKDDRLGFELLLLRRLR